MSEFLTDDRHCVKCGEPVTEVTGMPHDEMVDATGHKVTLSVAYELKPCGDVYIQALERPVP